MPDVVTMTMRETKQTKGTIVFTEVVENEDRPHTFYILRDLYGEMGSPDTLFVTLDPQNTATPNGEDV